MAAILRTFAARNFKCRYLQWKTRMFSTNAPKEGEDEGFTDQPIKYSTSKAAKWRAEHTFSGSDKEDVSHPAQPTVVIISLAVFMIYFGILREENDIDEMIYQPIGYDQFGKIREQQILEAIQHYKTTDPNYDLTNLYKRLEEVRQSSK